MRAKFRCSTVMQGGQAKYVDGKATDETEVTFETVTFNAVYGPEGSANRTWATATPSGQLVMTINNKAAFGHFKPGKCYFLDFFEASEND